MGPHGLLACFLGGVAPMSPPTPEPTRTRSTAGTLGLHSLKAEHLAKAWSDSAMGEASLSVADKLTDMEVASVTSPVPSRCRASAKSKGEKVPEEVTSTD